MVKSKLFLFMMSLLFVNGQAMDRRPSAHPLNPFNAYLGGFIATSFFTGLAYTFGASFYSFKNVIQGTARENNPWKQAFYFTPIIVTVIPSLVTALVIDIESTEKKEKWWKYIKNNKFNMTSLIAGAGMASYGFYKIQQLITS